jgi:hypothetical protein
LNGYAGDRLSRGLEQKRKRRLAAILNLECQKVVGRCPPKIDGRYWNATTRSIWTKRNPEQIIKDEATMSMAVAS